MASNKIEIESKVLLSKEDYERVLSRVDFGGKTKIQDNYYLDTPDLFLKKYGITLRLRHRDGYKLTLKAPLSEGLLQKDQILDEDEAKELIDKNVFPEGDINYFIQNLHLDPKELKVLAELTTVRKETLYKGNPINVSKNTYSGKTDYELEADADSEATSKKVLQDLCLELDIAFKINDKSKEERAITEAQKK
ncbi:MAG: CYTH domain-containing protein [Bacilli bacterium]|jgi:uncharacterized protein YjbK